MLGKPPNRSCWQALFRQKAVETVSLGNSQLARVLTTFDLTALGVGSTLGVGVYVLAGNVSRNIAGPAVVLSFVIAAFASLFAGLCYAEFGARVPRAGSAYIYSYVCIGEFIAFIIGWNLILEYIIGSASVAKGLSKYLDTLMNETMEQKFREIAPMDAEFLSPYFDIFAFAMSVILAVALAMGVKESSLVNNAFTIINIVVVMFVIIAGSFKVDTKNWNLTKEEVPEGAGKGGFFPFGISGAISGAATCFYGFVGFDCVATTGEEVKNPQRAIPIAIISSLVIIFFSYFGVSTVLTLMWPYYLQDPDAPIPKAFMEMGWPAARWVVTIGGIFGLCASLFGAMFPLPRIIYAMSTDGLIFKFLGEVHKRFKTPFYGTIFSGLLTGLMAAIFDLDQLVNMMSIGTLLAYTIVAACVLLLRYTELDPYGVNDLVNPEYVESTNLVTLQINTSCRIVMKQIFQPSKHPTSLSSKIVAYEVVIFSILSLLLGLCVRFWKDGLKNMDPFAVSITSTIAAFLLLILMSVGCQPKSSTDLSFKVPLVPLTPALSILVNIYLMLMLDYGTWIRFAVWMVIGLIIYFLYGMRKSKAPYPPKDAKEVKTAKGEVNEALEEDSETSGTDQQKRLSNNNYGDTESPTIFNKICETLPITMGKDSVLKQDSSTKFEEEDIKKSLACIEDLEKILDFNDNLKFTDTVANARDNRKTDAENAPSSDVCLLQAATLSKPASFSKSPASGSNTPQNARIRSTKKISTASLYPNVIVVSYDSDSESIDTKHKEDISEQSEWVNGSNDESHMKINNFSPNDLHSNSNPHINNTDVSVPPPPPPPPPPPSSVLPITPPTSPMTSSSVKLPQPLPSVPSNIPAPPPLPPPSPPPSPKVTNSPPVSSGTNSEDENSSMGESGYDTINGRGKHTFNKYKTEPSTPVVPDAQFLLRMGSLKNSDFALKLESILQERLYVVKSDDNALKKPSKFTKNNSTYNNHTGKTTKKWTIPNTEPNIKHDTTKIKTRPEELSDTIINKDSEQNNTRDDDLTAIKWKLEKFLANRNEVSVLKRHSSHPNLTSLIKVDNETKDVDSINLNEDAKPKLNSFSGKKPKDDDHFDMVKKQRMLMGEVLASIKFVSNKNSVESKHGSDLDSISDNSENNEEVFEDFSHHSKSTVHL